MTGDRLTVTEARLNLAPRYLDASPSDRYEIVREIALGERCHHGYPDQGEGCETCSAVQT